MKRISKPKLNQGITGDGKGKSNPYTVRRRIREQLAKIPRPKVKAKAVAAFLFMPQLRTSFESLVHLYPIMVRMVAVLFAECSLIKPTHEALNYKRADEKSNYSFKQLIGDAWFTLKTSKVTTYQYGMFGAVMIMIVTLMGALGAFFMRLVVGVGTTVQAQVFGVFQNPNDPYGVGGNPSIWTSINAGTGNITAPAGGMLFDQRMYAPASGTNNHITADWALMVLDKVLRQSMLDTPNGGVMQNALRSLMMTYNSGMLVIACIMIGWMVLSVMIDTAKTGTVGGGRHNMVWLPVRVLFALGIMFPLGSVGYSGGQYMVVKLAEWGSNWGTRGWTTYVSSVVGNQQLLAPYNVKNAANLVNGITKIMVCQVAYNTYVRQRTGLLSPEQVITRYRDDPTNSGSPYLKNRYTNTANTNVCGSISYGSNFKPDDQAAQLAWDPTPAAQTTPFTISSNRAAQPDNVYTNTGLATAAKAYRTAMRAAVESEIEEVLAADGNGAARVGPSITAARQFACKFVARRFVTGDASSVANNPVADIAVADPAGNPAVVPECAGVTAAASDPDISTIANMHKAIQAAMMGAFTGAARPALETYIGVGQPPMTGPMLTEMSVRGWAGMGMWYQDIVTLNNIMLSVRAPFATIEPGGAWVGVTGEGWEDGCSGGSNKNPQGEACKFPGIAEKVMGIMGEYDRWWGVSSMVSDAGKGGVPGAAQSNEELSSSPTSTMSSTLSQVGSMTYGNNGIINIFLRVLFPRWTDTFIFKAVDLQATNTYPLTQLADTGHTILGIGLALWTGISVFQTVSTIDAAGFSAGKGLAFSALMQVLASLGSVMIMTGVMISFYLPALPFLRVAFAVLTWITSVYEAVVMVPVAALTHLSTTGPGLMGQHGRIAWVMWFNVFMRPILVVFGFVGGMLIFNAFTVYFHTSFSQGAAIIMSGSAWYSPAAYISKICYSVVYLATLYSVANTTFKLMDIFPNQMGRWMGEWGARGGGTESMDPGHSGLRSLGFAGAQFADEMKRAIPGRYISEFRNSVDWQGDRAENALKRAGLLAADSGSLDSQKQSQRLADQLLTKKRLSGRELAEYAALDSDFKRDRFLVEKFLAQENNRYHRFFFEKGMSARGGAAGKAALASGIMADLGVHGARALHGGLGRGQLAGASVHDQELDKALGNTTHTSNWDELSFTQRDNIEKKVLGSLSQADMLVYAGMDDQSKLEFIQSVYNDDPETFAPGVDKAGVDKMIDFLKFPEKLDQEGNMALASTLMGQMTRAQKDKATRAYLKWANDSGRSTEQSQSMLLGQLGGMSVKDRMLDSALKFGSQYKQKIADGIAAHRLVTAAYRKYGWEGRLAQIEKASADTRREITELKLAGVLDTKNDTSSEGRLLEVMSAEESAAYAKANAAQRKAIYDLKFEQLRAMEDYQSGKIDYMQRDMISQRNNIVMSTLVADINAGGLILDNHARALVMMTKYELAAHGNMTDEDKQKLENLALKRRLYTKQLANGTISSQDYYAKMMAVRDQIAKDFDIKRPSAWSRRNKGKHDDV